MANNQIPNPNVNSSNNKHCNYLCQAPSFPVEDPDYIYPLSSFPPSSFWEQHIVVPALIVPAQRTAELRNQLKHVLRNSATGAAKSKQTNPVQSLMDQDDITFVTCCGERKHIIKNRSQYRKLILRKVFSPQSASPGIVSSRQDAMQDNNNDENDVFNDPTVQALLLEADDKLRCYKSTHEIVRSYPDDYTVDQILKMLFPTVSELPGSSFEVVGTIAHINLRDEFMPFKYWIGKVLYDKHQPRIQTVVAKIGTIDTVYRTFDMEVIAPCRDVQNITPLSSTIPTPLPNWNIVTVSEEGCHFQLDYQRVYWNSRLSGEHRRLVQLLLRDPVRQQNPQEPLVVVDLMAGIGPFAVPLTNTTCRNSETSSLPPVVVHANDLNPSCYHYLQINARRNKCHDQQLHLYNMDGRCLVHKLQDSQIEVDHFIMNLPAMAPECCAAFRGYSHHKKKVMPKLHVYCFAPKEDVKLPNEGSISSDSPQQQQPHKPYQAAVDRCSSALQCDLDWQRDDVDIHVVRDVAPNKNMLCVSFRLPIAVQDVPRVSVQANGDPPAVMVTEAISFSEKVPEAEACSSQSHDAKRIKLLVKQQN